MNELLKWAGTAAQVVGVFMLSSRLAEPVAAFVVMLVGSALWMLAATIARDWPALVLNTAFTASNALGIARWIAP